jgi:hypothetical protein
LKDYKNPLPKWIENFLFNKTLKKAPEHLPNELRIGITNNTS